jgi:hypothetical protein
MRKLIDEAIGRGPYVPRKLATEIVEKLRATDPELLEGWLAEQAEHFIWQAINDRDRAVRAHLRHTHMRGVFADAAQKFEQGDKKALEDFLGMPFTIADGSRHRLEELKRDDLLYVGDRYEQRERQNGMMKIFMRELAKKVGNSTVGQVYTNEQLKQMFDSFGLGGDIPSG